MLALEEQLKNEKEQRENERKNFAEKTEKLKDEVAELKKGHGLDGSVTPARAQRRKLPGK